MANQLSGQTGASVREYAKHKRHSIYARRRHGRQLAAWLSYEATRLTSTSAVIYAKVIKYGAAKVAGAANLAAIP